jgi:hypothetical protein
MEAVFDILTHAHAVFEFVRVWSILKWGFQIAAQTDFLSDDGTCFTFSRNTADNQGSGCLVLLLEWTAPPRPGRIHPSSVHQFTNKPDTRRCFWDPELATDIN